MIKIRNLLFSLFACGALLPLSGCKLAILDPRGVIAADEKHLLITSVLLMLIVVVPVILLTLIFAWKYRAGNTKSTYTPDWSHSNAIEIVCWTIPCIIIGILATITWISSHQLDPYKPLATKIKPITIEAIALDWKWLFIYPDENIATINFVQIPVNVPIRFLITSDAPMNSFEIPQLAGQIYAMAGMKTKLNLMATEAGNFKGLSTNFSGDGFSGMSFVVRASSLKTFNDWVNQVQTVPNKLTMSLYSKLERPSENNPVQYFSYAKNESLFSMVMMKFMMPMPNMGMNKNYASNPPAQQKS